MSLLKHKIEFIFPITIKIFRKKKVIKKIIIFGHIFIINYKFTALNPTQDGHFLGQLTNVGERGGKKVPLTKNCHTYSTCHSYALPKENPKIYVNHVTHPLSPADTSILSLKIKKFYYFKKYRSLKG